MMKVVFENYSRLRAVIDAKYKESLKNSCSVIVGYTASYALRVHEDLKAVHPNGQAKYLIEPTHRLQPEVRKIIQEALRRGATLAQAIYAGALLIQRESQLIVPVDSGNLRGSAITQIERDASNVSVT